MKQLGVLISILLSLPVLAAPAAAGRYADPALLAMPWGNYSFVRQAWRGYSETLPAVAYVNGLGVVWGRTPRGMSEEQTAEALAWAGFRRVRVEIPWGSVRWDELGFDEGTERRLLTLLPALRKNGLRPLILLNANHGQPCPVRLLSVEVAEAAAAGGRTLTLGRGVPGGLTSFPVTVTSFADGNTAGPLVDSYREDGGRAVIALSKSLPRAVPAGETLRLAQLKYPPLQPPNTPQFERTVQGWLTYVRLVARYMELLYGSDDYDVEIWNELTFGSAFLDARLYADPTDTPHERPDLLRPGGQAWELANRTTLALKHEHPQVKVVWGFSNTTWFHTPITELPPGTDGQSYHPYGTGRRCYADLVRGRLSYLLDGFIPRGCSIQPEGYAHTWQQTESLVRLIAPQVITVKPSESTEFSHFITEHGVVPAEVGASDAEGARLAKRKFLLRAPLFWLNKGIAGLYVFDAYEESDLGMGVFNADGSISPGMTALHRLSSRFAAAVPLAATRQLEFAVQPLGADPGVLPGDPAGAHLPISQVITLLPFQVDPHHFIIGAYVMTQDFPRALPALACRVTVSNIDGGRAAVSLYEPDSDQTLSAKVTARTPGSISLEVPLTDVPRLIEIAERPAI